MSLLNRLGYVLTRVTERTAPTATPPNKQRSHDTPSQRIRWDSQVIRFMARQIVDNAQRHRERRQQDKTNE